MKKVGIMTHHRYYNQGTMLQAYALQRKIELLGYQAELIDYKEVKYRPIYERIKNKILHPIKTVKEISILVNARTNSDKIQKSKNKYDEFYNNIKISSKKYTSEKQLKEDLPEYDIYMVGSDQTWNPYLPINTDAYYLSFVPDNKTRVSYAPSIGGKDIPEEKNKVIKLELIKFKHISCRESKGCKLLEKILDRKVEEVLDPTFLLPIEEWKKISKTTLEEDEKYMICYFLGDVKNNIKNAERTAKLLGLKPYYIYTYDSRIKKNLNYLYDVGPAEFLGLIRNAQFVCTDSFHGSVFSIIFNKQFFSFTKRKDKGVSDNNRIYELLKLFNLNNRYISQEKIVKNSDISKIDYKNVNSILNNRKIQSEEFLEKCLK